MSQEKLKRNFSDEIGYGALDDDEPTKSQKESKSLQKMPLLRQSIAEDPEEINESNIQDDDFYKKLCSDTAIRAAFIISIGNVFLVLSFSSKS